MAKFRLDTKRARGRKYRYKPLPDGTTNLLSVPDEVLLEIAEYLYLPDFENLSVVCRRFLDAFSTHLKDAQRDERARWRDVELTSEAYGYHDLLLQIVKREVNPNYVKRLDCRNACLRRATFHDRDEISIARYIGWTDTEIILVRAAISRSPWLEPIIPSDELIAKILEGSEDATLALLVPLLNNLTMFLPPQVETYILHRAFSRIARAEVTAEREHPEVLHKLPLRNLRTLFIDTMYYGWAFQDPCIYHYISLPSIKRIFIRCTEPWDGYLEEAFPKIDAPQSRASEVYIVWGESYEEDTRLLANYFAGPCTFRQFALGSLWPNPAWDNGLWDHCHLTTEKINFLFDAKPDNSREILEDSMTKRSIRFEQKYREFHPHGPGDPDTVQDFERYDRDIRASGMVPSPQWLALLKWHSYMATPDTLDDDTFNLDE